MTEVPAMQLSEFMGECSEPGITSDVLKLDVILLLGEVWSPWEIDVF